MSRAQKISLLKTWNVSFDARATNAELDALISSNRLATRCVNFQSGRIDVKFDKATEEPVEVVIYEQIGDDPFGGGGFTAKDFLEAVKDVPNTRPLDLRINSAGGSVWEGMAIKTRLDEWKGKKTASIDGMAASVASWLPMSFDEIRAPRHAQMFIHPAWGLVMGNAEDMRRQADELDKTSGQIAEMYARRTGMTPDECLELMNEQTLMTGEEAMKLGFIDRLTEDPPISNFSETQVRNMKAKLLALSNCKTQKPKQGDNQHNETGNIMNRKELEALLNKLGVKFNASDSDDKLKNLVLGWKPKNAVKFKNGKDGEHADDCDCEDCDKPKNAPEPDAPEEGDADAPKKATDTELFTAATANLKSATAKFDTFFANQRRATIQNALDRIAGEGKIPVNSIAEWLPIALGTPENDKGENPIIARLSSLPANQLPGHEPVSIDVGDPGSIVEVDRSVQNLLKQQGYYSRNGRGPENMAARIMVGQNSRQAMRLVRNLMKWDKPEPRGMIAPINESDPLAPRLIGPVREAWDRWAMGGPQNANTMSTQLLRQVILSEVMRAFRRQFASLSIFAHNFGIVPLEGTDYVEVPYYPLDTTASSEFTQAAGYVITPASQTLYKQILVGGKGGGTATSGSGRKYKGLQFSAYEIRRQPWLDIQKLSVMAGEQLAIDVRGDILGTFINSTNFANAIWTGAAGGFDHTIVGNVLLQAAISAFWPIRGRNVVLAPAYYTNLAIDPGITPLLAIGTTDVLREGIVGGLYGFENIIHDPKIPVANFIRGGDGAVTAGTDLNLAGFMAWPSALLIATAPIMPPPGVLKKLVAYEQITDDQTGLAFTYQFFGDEKASVDNEIIECTYGAGLGELAALFRLTSAGN